MSEIPPVLGLHIETAKFLLSVVGTVGALCAFVAGLVQYRNAQLWRRKEFIGREVKEFLADRVVRNALLMIDWSTRRIPFDASTPREAWPKITREAQVAALEPHFLRPISPENLQNRDYRRYTDAETLIRDTYDIFLDGLERLSAFSDSGLFREHELLPYLGYWIDDMASLKGPAEDRRWRLSLLAYIHFYRFSGVRRLFSRLGTDIAVGGEVWRSLSQADPALARRLEVACENA